jgi:hypothetical protein
MALIWRQNSGQSINGGGGSMMGVSGSFHIGTVLIEVVRKIADAVNESIRVVGILLVTMRQRTNLGVDEPICPNKCNICNMKNYCTNSSASNP